MTFADYTELCFYIGIGGIVFAVLIFSRIALSSVYPYRQKGFTFDNFKFYKKDYENKNIAFGGLLGLAKIAATAGAIFLMAAVLLKAISLTV